MPATQNEDARADEWLFAKLNVAAITALLGAATDIYGDEPDPSGTFPMVVFRQIVPFIAESPQRNRMILRAQYAVFAKVQDRVFPYQLDAEIRDVLHLKREVIGEYVLISERVGNWRDSYAVEGKPYREMGGRFALTLHCHS